MPLKTIAGFKFKHSLWLKCQQCDYVVNSESDWIKWWLIGKRIECRKWKDDKIIRCPRHITRAAMVSCGAPGARAKGFRLLLEELKDHYDDDPQPSIHMPIIFPNKQEYEYFKNTPMNVRW